MSASAVQLRQQGLSLRQIADQLAVTSSTIKRDLARWEADQVDQLLCHIGVPYDSIEDGMAQPYGTATDAPYEPEDRRMQ